MKQLHGNGGFMERISFSKEKFQQVEKYCARRNLLLETAIILANQRGMNLQKNCLPKINIKFTIPMIGNIVAMC